MSAAAAPASPEDGGLCLSRRETESRRIRHVIVNTGKFCSFTKH